MESRLIVRECSQFMFEEVDVVDIASPWAFSQWSGSRLCLASCNDSCENQASISFTMMDFLKLFLIVFDNFVDCAKGLHFLVLGSSLLY